MFQHCDSLHTASEFGRTDLLFEMPLIHQSLPSNLYGFILRLGLGLDDQTEKCIVAPGDQIQRMGSSF